MSTLVENVEQLRGECEAMIRTARTILRQLGAANSGEDALLAVDVIMDVVAQYYGLPVSVMRSRARPANFVRPRHLALYLTRELTPLSLEEIARSFRPDMDHGAVIHAHRSVADRLQTDARFAETVATLRARCVERIENVNMPLFSR